MKVPCCSVCHTRYDEEERVPLLLDCGHGFCRACLTRMFAASRDTTLPCPRCRHTTTVGNSVHALRKNFPVLDLLASSPSSPSFECDFADQDGGDEAHDDDDDDGEDDYFQSRSSHQRRSRLSAATVASCCCSAAGTSTSGGSAIDLASHHDLKLLRRLGEGRRAGHETWSAVFSGAGGGTSSSATPNMGGRCRHQVAVKRVALTEDMDVVWMQSQLEGLRRASMWCRNVCTFHGAIRMDGHLCLVMDRYNSSLQSEMQQNKGRLTLEQILRFFWSL